jgi:hypothetical protein
MRPRTTHKQWLIELIAAEPDPALEEIRARLNSKRKEKAGIGSIWRFFAVTTSPSKKHCTPPHRSGLTSLPSALALKAERPKLRRRASFLSTRPRSQRRWSGTIWAFSSR